MRDHILILGGYGNFGKRIAGALTRADIPVTIAGRNQSKAEALAQELGNDVQCAIFDIGSGDFGSGLDKYLRSNPPAIIINTCGPFQLSDYRIVETCINQRIHYLDLADGRDFVNDIWRLNDQASHNETTIISGASTVPGLSSAVLDHFTPEFSEITSLKYGISPGQKAERGLATTKGILTYVGKPLAEFQSLPGTSTYGWQNIYRQSYPVLRRRWMANCEIPDLDLLPPRYGLKHIQFSAGMELGLLHLGLWGLSGLVRAGLPLRLERHAGLLLKLSNLFNHFGSADGGMHMIMQGLDHHAHPLTRKWFIIARNGHGPEIPTVPAIILAKKLWAGEDLPSGAYPCVGLVSLSDYLDELSAFDIETVEA